MQMVASLTLLQGSLVVFTMPECCELAAFSAFSAQRGEILRGPVRHIERIPVGPLIAADSAYPGIPWLVKPYQNVPNLERSNIRFSTILSKARVVVERPFGILKGRWRCLRKELEVDTNNVPKIVVACCILHNICIMMGE